MKTVFKTFKTPNGNYVYDRETNSILSISEKEYIALANIENDCSNQSDLEELGKLQQ